jgi:hypothetical protein
VGIDQVGHGLGLGQVELAVEKGAQRELARLRQAQVARRAEFEAARQQQLQHHRAAVGLQFEHVLAGVGIRRGEEQGQAVVDRRALGVEEGAVVGQARGQGALRDRSRQRRQVAARDAHDADRAAAGRGGDGDDRVVGQLAQ